MLEYTQYNTVKNTFRLYAEQKGKNKMEKIRFAVIGLGHRGLYMIRDNLVHFTELDFVAISDLYEDRMDDVEKIIVEKRPDAAPIF